VANPSATWPESITAAAFLQNWAARNVKKKKKNGSIQQIFIQDLRILCFFFLSSTNWMHFMYGESFIICLSKIIGAFGRPAQDAPTNVVADPNMRFVSGCKLVGICYLSLADNGFLRWRGISYLPSELKLSLGLEIVLLLPAMLTAF